MKAKPRHLSFTAKFAKNAKFPTSISISVFAAFAIFAVKDGLDGSIFVGFVTFVVKSNLLQSKATGLPVAEEA